MGRVCFIVGVISLIILAMSAQGAQVTLRFFEKILPGEEWMILKLPQPGLVANVDRMRCGDYFLFVKESPHAYVFLNKRPEDTKVWGPFVGFETGEMPKEPEKGGVFWTFLQSNIQVIIDSSKKVPTAERTGDLNVVIRISRGDYGKSESCLPKPSP